MTDGASSSWIVPTVIDRRYIQCSRGAVRRKLVGDPKTVFQSCAGSARNSRREAAVNVPFSIAWPLSARICMELSACVSSQASVQFFAPRAAGLASGPARMRSWRRSRPLICSAYASNHQPLVATEASKVKSARVYRRRRRRTASSDQAMTAASSRSRVWRSGSSWAKRINSSIAQAPRRWHSGP